jgi:glycosyltransferase involved in cell wall biosynthesis
MTDRLKIGIGFQLTTYTGWGVVAMNIALELAARDDVELHFWSADFQGLNALDLSRLLPIAQRCQVDLATAHAKGRPLQFDGVLFWADGNHCAGVQLNSAVRSDRNMGLMVFEDTALTPEKLGRLRSYDWLVTASRWNRDVLQSHGLKSHLVPQGIDPTIFHPAPRSGRWRDRFVVFSGGKLEYRKGQDIVLAAFREFHARHPDALLVTAWQNKWPQLVRDMTLNGYIEKAPVVTSEGVDIEGWFADNGLPDDAALDLGLVPNALLGQIMREAGVAVFASRAEGGTNLMAMEAVAAGVQTLVSCNTGHADLHGGAVRVLEQSAPSQPTAFFDGIEGWGETDPATLCYYLDDYYGLRHGTQATWLPCSWQQHTDELVKLIQP